MDLPIGPLKTLFWVGASISPDGAVAISLANRLVGTGFILRYQLQPRAGFSGSMGRCKATIPTSFSLTFNRVTTNY